MITYGLVTNKPYFGSAKSGKAIMEEQGGLIAIL